MPVAVRAIASLEIELSLRLTTGPSPASTNSSSTVSGNRKSPKPGNFLISLNIPYVMLAFVPRGPAAGFKV